MGLEVVRNGGTEASSGVRVGAPPRQRLSKAWLALAVVGGVWVVGQVARDRWLVTAWAFYVPTAVVAVVLGVGMAVVWRRPARRGVRWLVLAVWLASLGTFAVVENRWVPPREGRASEQRETGGASELREAKAASELRGERGASQLRETEGASEVRGARGANGLRIVHWNVLGGRRGVPALLDRLVEQRGDVYVLSEGSTGRIRRLLPMWLGEGWFYHQSRTISVVSRWPMVAVEDRRVPGGSVLGCRLAVEGGERLIWAVDIASHPLVSRAPACRALRELLERGPRPAAIVGDFNLPRGSYLLARMAEGYEQAYHAAGWGWSYSWPMPMPLWALDHCLVEPPVRVVRYELVGTRDSDHRMQVIDLEWR